MQLGFKPIQIVMQMKHTRKQ
uniref:Uncharacterized protein n=1 Tax=Arundo donax TaxID=35708 RepID=A0A0A9ARH4_ARUDO